MDPADDILTTAPVRAAIAAGRAGEVIRLVRTAHGIRQADLGAAVGFSQSRISRIEAGTCTDLRTLRAIARHLGIPGPAVGLAPIDDAGSRSTPTLSVGEGSGMERQTFIKGLLGAVAALALPPVLTADTSRVGPGEVTACRDALARLYSLDTQIGAGHVETLNAEMISRLKRLTARASYGADVGRGLREVLAAATEHAGWLAYDAGRQDDARRWWLESLHAADIGNHPAVRTVVLASMSLQSSALRRSDAADLAEAAIRGVDVTPRVQSIIAARAGLGLAVRGDRAGTHRQLALASETLGAGTSDHDPTWTSFWGEADLMSHESRAAALLGDFPHAERAARRGVEVSAGSGQDRNHALYSLRLARILTSRAALDEAIQVATPVVGLNRSVSSGRIRADLRATVAGIGGHRDYQPAREFAAWAGRMTA